MKTVLRAMFIFVFFCLTFISSNNSFAYSSVNGYNQTFSSISATKSEITFANQKEEYYIISNNQNRCEITNQSNKNDTFGLTFANRPIFDNYIFNNYVSDKNSINLNRINHNISQNLKNAIYTRAP
jgi:hypothetical protein